jgi:flagellar assembly factor FliW
MLVRRALPEIETKNFGRIPYEDDAALIFPRGLPGFENRGRFLPMTFPGREPLVFLQSLEDPDLCFITLPIWAAHPSYRLDMTREDMTLIGLRPGARARVGEDLLCLAVISVGPDGPTANLLAPLVVNLRNRHSVQAVAASSRYSHRHPLVVRQPSPERAPRRKARPCS